jgi:zinc protease
MRANRITFIIILLLGLNPQAYAGSKLPEVKSFTLPSGQQVYVQEIHGQPIITVDTWVNTGSAQETPENNGVSHFLEHLLFKGTPALKVGEMDKRLESRGAHFNAATSKDFTHYHITTATPYFNEALKLHADMLINASIPVPELDRERKVVQEEINRSLDNPDRKAYLALSKTMYGQHPYSFDTLGPKSNIQNISRDSITEYYHRWYQPANFKTIIVGDVHAEEIARLVQAEFDHAAQGRTFPTSPTPQLFPIAPITTPASSVLTDSNVSSASLTLGFRAPSIQNRDDNYALDVASMILGQGASSRLNNTLREKLQRVTSIMAANSTQQQAGEFYVVADLKPENRAKAKASLLEVLNTFKQDGPTIEELEKAKTQVIKQFAFQSESTEGLAETIGYNVTIGQLSDYADYVQNIQKITAQDVQRVVKQYLDFNQAVLVELLPQGSLDLKAEAEANKTLLSQAAQTSNLLSKEVKTEVLPEQTPSQFVLPSGALLILKPVPTSQTVAITLLAKGGKLLEQKTGVSVMTARLLTRGTTGKSASELNTVLDKKGLSLSTGADEDYFQVSASSVAADSESLIDVLEDILLHPTFPQEELQKERQNMLQELKTARDEPSNLMFETLTQTLYAGHPYGKVGSQLEQPLQKLTRNDLREFYEAQLDPKRLIITVVGQFDAQYVKNRLMQITRGLSQATHHVSKPFAQPKRLQSNVNLNPQKPEQAATWIAQAWPAPPVSRQKTFISLKLINTLLGSGLSSRLFTELREKQGLAYQVGSMFPSQLQTGSFTLFIGTDPKNEKQVLKGFQQQISRLIQEPLTAEELAQAKSKLIGSFALAHESNADQAYYLGVYQALGVGYQFDTDFPKLVEGLTASDIQTAAKAIFTRPRVQVIVSPKHQRVEKSNP